MLRDGLVATKRVKDLLHPCGNRFRSTSDWQLKELLSNLHVLIIQAGESWAIVALSPVFTGCCVLVERSWGLRPRLYAFACYAG